MDYILIGIGIFVVVFFVWATVQSNNLSLKKEKKKKAKAKDNATPKVVEPEKEKNVKSVKIKKKAIEQDNKMLGEQESSQINEKPAVGGGKVERVFVNPVPKEEPVIEKESKKQAEHNEDDDFEKELEQLIKDLENERNMSSPKTKYGQNTLPNLDRKDTKIDFDWNKFDEVFSDEPVESLKKDNDYNLINNEQQPEFDFFADSISNLNTNEAKISEGLTEKVLPNSPKGYSAVDYGSNQVVEVLSPKIDDRKTTFKEPLDKTSFAERLNKGFDSKIVRDNKVNNQVVVNRGDLNSNSIAKQKRKKWM